eukprot:6175012-Pleurochrysis_carterae.AAC.1
MPHLLLHQQPGPNRRGGAVHPLTIIRRKLAIATTSVVRKASCSQSTRLHRGDRGKEPSGSRCRHALGN